jgi:hypothetical protein
VTLSRQNTIDWSGKINTQTKSFAQFVAVSRPVTSPTFSTTIDFMLVKMAFKAQNLGEGHIWIRRRFKIF